MNAVNAETGKQTLRQLDFRSSGGIDVTLLWDARNDELTVTVFDSSTNELFELPADRERALDVFNHPFAYAASCLELSCVPVFAGGIAA